MLSEVGTVIVKGNNVEIQGLQHVANTASARERSIDKIEDKDFMQGLMDLYGLWSGSGKTIVHLNSKIWRRIILMVCLLKH